MPTARRGVESGLSHAMLTLLIAAGLFVVAPLHPGLQAGEPAKVSDITDRIVCTCGCSSMVLRSCLCGVADAMREKILTLIEEGKSSDEIVAHYVDKHGEVILAAPTKVGFNLTAWILPSVLIAIAAAFVILVLIRWTVRKTVPAAEPSPAAEDAEYLARIEEELKNR